MKPLLIMVGGWAMPDFLWDDIVARVPASFECRIVSCHAILENPPDFWSSLRQEAERRTVIGIGWSLGGLLLIDAQINFNAGLSSMILLGSTARMTEDHNYPGAKDRHIAAMIAGIRRAPEKVLRDFFKSAFSDNNYSRYSDRLLKHGLLLTADSLVKGLEFLRSSDLRGNLSMLDLPVAILHGEDDMIITADSAKYLSSAVRSSRLHIIKSAGHDLPVSCPDLILSMLPKSVAQFSELASSYDCNAGSQRRIGRDLIEFAGDMAADNLNCLDLGCGTGFISNILSDLSPQGKVTAIDSAPGMIEFCRNRLSERSNIKFILADAVTYSSGAEFDRIFSNLCLQWMPDLQATFRQISFNLKEGGRFFFSTLLCGSFKEISESYRKTVEAQWPGLEFRTEDNYLQALSAAGMNIEKSEVREYVFEYPSALDACNTLKKIGAGAHGALYRPLTPGSMRKMLRYYNENYAASRSSVSLTYRVMFVRAQEA